MLVEEFAKHHVDLLRDGLASGPLVTIGIEPFGEVALHDADGIARLPQIHRGGTDRALGGF
jgi:hypothetical protein